MQAKCIDFDSPFYCISSNYLSFFTYYVSFWILLNILRNSRLFYANRPHRRVRDRKALFSYFACLLKQATSFWDHICGHQTDPILILSNYGTLRYRLSSSSGFISCRCIISTNWSNICGAFCFYTDSSISDNATDERQDHFPSCVQETYGCSSKWCDCCNNHLNMRRVTFHCYNL